ncbi:MAG: hypothetical protein JXA97_07185 [Anaerolineales bacterium]|nr:hypothetical protein [Anaerolineales bacterium]
MTASESKFLKLMRLCQPGLMILTSLTYSLGAAIAYYLGRRFSWGLFLQGLLLILTIQCMGRCLLALAEFGSSQDAPRPSIFPPTTAFSGEAGLSHTTLQYAALTFLGLAAVQAAALVIQGSPATAWISLVLILLAAYFYATPPLNLRSTGLGEIILAITASLLPAYAFALLTGTFHRYILMTSIPIAALALAAQIVLALPCYAYDRKHRRQNLIVRLDWATGMFIHDVSILAAVVGLAAASLSGLPRQVAGGTLIAAPLAILQILQMRRIQGGAPPHWKLFAYSAVSLYTLTVYLMLMGFIL